MKSASQQSVAQVSQAWSSRCASQHAHAKNMTSPPRDSGQAAPSQPCAISTVPDANCEHGTG